LLRKIVLNLHTYGGLICFSYLIIFGLSTLNFNHPFAFTRTAAGVRTWTQPLLVTPALGRTEGKSAAESLEIRRANNAAILGALGSFANPFTAADGDWTDADTYHAHFVRVGKEYQIDVHPGTGSATVTQARSGVWALMWDLHGGSSVYGYSAFAGTWRWYTDACVYVVVFAGASGVYLWAKRPRERRIGLAMLGVAGAVSISLMLLVTFRG